MNPYDDPWQDEGDVDDDQTDTISCAECGAEVYEDAVQCPACGNFIIPDTRSASRLFPPWLVWTVSILIIVGLILGIVGPLL